MLACATSSKFCPIGARHAMRSPSRSINVTLMLRKQTPRSLRVARWLCTSRTRKKLARAPVQACHNADVPLQRLAPFTSGSRALGSAAVRHPTARMEARPRIEQQRGSNAVLWSSLGSRQPQCARYASLEHGRGAGDGWRSSPMPKTGALTGGTRDTQPSEPDSSRSGTTCEAGTARLRWSLRSVRTPRRYACATSLHSKAAAPFAPLAAAGRRWRRLTRWTRWCCPRPAPKAACRRGASSQRLRRPCARRLTAPAARRDLDTFTLLASYKNNASARSCLCRLGPSHFLAGACRAGRARRRVS